MDLPTYTSIWRIEKRLYKLYDFRLPMPVPVGQIAVFAAITVPYVILLTILGLPFNHTLFWLYVLPPGVITWLATRPVLESKRLPELVISQVRYLGEPGTWCRMAPLAEKDDVMVVGKVWRRDEEVRGRRPRPRPWLRPPPLPPPGVRPGSGRGRAQSRRLRPPRWPGHRPPRRASRPGCRAPLRRRGCAARRASGAGRRSGPLAPWPGGVDARRGQGAAPAVAAETAPAEIAHDERQAPVRPAPAGQPGCAGGRPGPVGRPGPWAAMPPGRFPGQRARARRRGRESVTRPARPEGAARPSGATWPVRTRTPRPGLRQRRAAAEPPWALPCPRPRRLRSSGTRGVLARTRRSRLGQKRAGPGGAGAGHGGPSPGGSETRSRPGDRSGPGGGGPSSGKMSSVAGPRRMRLRGRIWLCPRLPPGPWSRGRRRGLRRSQRLARRRSRLPRPRRGQGQVWRWGWLRLFRCRLLRPRRPCLRHACPGRPDSSSAWTRPGGRGRAGPGRAGRGSAHPGRAGRGQR